MICDWILSVTRHSQPSRFGMNKGIVAFLLVVLTSSATMLAASEVNAQWTAQQEEVIDQLQSCLNETDMEVWLGCYHENYLGWYRDSSTPLDMAGKKEIAATWDWTVSADGSLTVPFKPLSVYITDSVAITISANHIPMGYYREGDPSRTERWTIILVEYAGAWRIISEHVDQIGDK